MTIYSVAIISRGGVVLTSIQNSPLRHFESTVSQFSHLDKDPKVTYILSEKVKYVYRAVEDVYIILITSLNSNIISDLSVLQSIIAVLSQRLDGISESKICSSVFETTSIITEFCNFDGTCETLTPSDIELNLAMQSVDEENYLQELKQKKEEAKKLADQRAAELQAEKKLKEKMEKEKEKEQKVAEEKLLEIQRLQEEQNAKIIEEEEAQKRAEKHRRSEVKTRRGGITLGKAKTVAVEEDEDAFDANF
ncbi:hypothetical protein EIN_405990 [Entamoeba invadens IP1]|uniref:Coatomer subunit delta n=1 Tax=Entamoeba invadens IP1 TaxID=370355 RepID=A0A0A1U747_ENTIV|nr:hypothetical protein EIN_405990 [Entamoeba invadens IP1]ELP90145.1 hypothetical protein EIN_405990 [Entamoeba invadens IP1]|eukprot:XP_004256916.1 hypothetical protein EIN_405990 [Entamoeba invadens IP1]